MGLVAVTIALLVIVTGLSVALADDTTEDEADIRVVPEDGGTLSPVVEIEGPRLSDAHERTATIDDREDVDYAVPVLMEVVQAGTPDSDDPVNVLAVGIVPSEGSPPVGGVSTDALEPGDPHYADGSYDGPETGDAVLSSGAAAQLEAEETDQLFLMSPRTGALSQPHEVTAIDDGADTASLSSELPVVVVRLSELQTLTGAAEEDLADQVLVGTESSAAEAAVEETYPNATVESDGDAGLAALQDDDLALATSAIALVVGIGICTLFITTASALVVERERQTLAVLASVGFPTRSRLAIVAIMTLGLTIAGGLIGIAVGYGGIALTNYLAMETVTSSAIATTHPAFIPYALGVAIGAGLFAMPYPLYLAARTDAIAELRR
ncbi:ABC transporter permease [Natronorubrum sp. JWXQ-INN-674]|uniref:ABC transporter permease n=1 Tax=Natronorubrum halalkaliphilum TaxID=2691917 RepID=A0A6B0VLE5_9EURY|nr:ABC transporter permease [Natronorubrum halalkaliphilum]